MMLLDRPHIQNAQIDALAQACGARRATGVPVVHRPDLITPKWERSLPPGLSIAEMISHIPECPADFWRHGVVTIDRQDGNGSEVVPREMWPYVRPRAGGPIAIHVNLYLPPQGSDVRSIIGLVASIAIIVAASLVTAGFAAPIATALGFGGFLTAGSISAVVGGALIAVGGSLALRALTPPPSIPALEAGSTGVVDKQLTPASINGNALRPGSPIPHVMGTRKVFPQFVVKPLNELIGVDEYVTAVLGLGGPHQHNNLRADGVAFADVEGLDYETREGHASDSLITLVPRQSFTTPHDLRMSEHILDKTNQNRLDGSLSVADALPQWHTFTSRLAPDEIWLRLAWPEGLSKFTDLTVTVNIPVRLRFRRRGDVSWNNCPEIHFSSNITGAFQKDIRFKWASMPGSPHTPPSNQGPIYAYKVVPGQDQTPTTSGWTAHSSFSTGSGNDLLSTSTVGTTKVTNCELYDDRVVFYLSSGTFAQDARYEIQMMAGHPYAAGNFTAATYAYVFGAGK